MTKLIDVRCTETGTWSVLPADRDSPLSTHTSETEAERAAQAHAAPRGARVLVHDRYERVHECSAIAHPRADDNDKSHPVVENVDFPPITSDRRAVTDQEHPARSTSRHGRPSK